MCARARNVVRDDDQRRARCFFRLEQQLVDLAGGDRIEAGARLVDEQDVRVERHRPRQAGALLHAAREVRRHLVEVLARGRRRPASACARSRIFASGQSVWRRSGNATFSPTDDRIEQRRVLKQKAHAAGARRRSSRRVSVGHVLAVHEHAARVRLASGR